MNNNEQQFSLLVKRHKETIYSVCLMFADNQDDANDLMQLSYEEIGQIVGITAKNVSVRLVRIKEQLKKMTD